MAARTAASPRKAYKTDLTDEQWRVLEPLVPAAKHRGRHRQVNIREVLNTIFYQNNTGCQWDMLPHDLLPKSTVYDYFKAWREDGTLQKMLDALRAAVRQQANREPTPSAGCIDSQTIKTTELGGERGFDGGKLIMGPKRHSVVDTLGLLLAVAVTTAKLDDGAAAPQVLAKLAPEKFPRLKKLWADQEYRNKALAAWLAAEQVSYAIEVKEKPEGTKGFVLLRRRWVVERTFAWLGRYRRNSKDYERSTASSEAMIKISAIHLMLRRLRPDASKNNNEFNYPKKTHRQREILPDSLLLRLAERAVPSRARSQSSSRVCGSRRGRLLRCAARGSDFPVPRSGDPLISRGGEWSTTGPAIPSPRSALRSEA